MEDETKKDENAKLKARLEEVMRIASDNLWHEDSGVVETDICVKLHNSYMNDILRAARGNEGKEAKMASKTYTSQEMRKKAKVMLGGLGNGVITMPSQASSRDVADMLLHAAEMRERCEEKLNSMRFDHYPPEIDDVIDFIQETLEYILRGDAGKEEK